LENQHPAFKSPAGSYVKDDRRPVFEEIRHGEEQSVFKGLFGIYGRQIMDLQTKNP